MAKTLPDCFVIMGFEEKQDPGTGRRLNLDSSYEFIIKPAVEAAGYNCIRADEILHSGIIDRPMYWNLLQAELVVADISTANANAIYELGVRHALRPRSTIVIKEEEGKRYFDLSHLATMSYKHLGPEIGAREAREKSAELQRLIEAVKAGKAPDSPVYHHLPRLKQPILAPTGGGGRGGSALPAASASSGPSRSELRKMAATALESESFEAARRDLEKLVDPEKVDDPWAIQKLALATYKSKKPNEKAALRKAQKIIQRLGPEESTDTETLGIAGAIGKRLWKLTGDRKHLDAAIDFCGRGWSVHEDYYTGENYANCLEMRADVATDTAAAAVDRMMALQVRNRLAERLTPLVRKRATKKLDDYKWMLATLANTQLALGDKEAASAAEKAFLGTKPANWEVETFTETKKDMGAQAKKYRALRKKMGL